MVLLGGISVVQRRCLSALIKRTGSAQRGNQRERDRTLMKDPLILRKATGRFHFEKTEAAESRDRGGFTREQWIKRQMNMPVYFNVGRAPGQDIRVKMSGNEMADERHQRKLTLAKDRLLKAQGYKTPYRPPADVNNIDWAKLRRQKIRLSKKALTRYHPRLVREEEFPTNDSTEPSSVREALLGTTTKLSYEDISPDGGDVTIVPSTHRPRWQKSKHAAALPHPDDIRNSKIRAYITQLRRDEALRRDPTTPEWAKPAPFEARPRTVRRRIPAQARR
eukprot:Sspe_Gene.115511::Locus_103056_Transcript_1_1_Confidence_1.000_Length_926::g.115511::m.115511